MENEIFAPKRKINDKSLANLKPIKPGERRNPAGRTTEKQHLINLIRKALKKKHINGVPNDEMIVQALIDLAVRGNLKAIEMVLNYTEGKPRESVDITSNGESLAPKETMVFQMPDGTQISSKELAKN